MNILAPSRISVVIPNYNDGEWVGRLLKQIGKLQVYEVIIVDAGSTDDSREIARQHQDIVWINSPKSRGQQIHKGIVKAKGDIIWVLHADSRLPERAQREIQRIMAKPECVLGCFRVKFDSKSRLLDMYSWFSKFDQALTTFGDQGYFFRRSDYLRTEGVAAWPLLEDVVLRRQLNLLGVGGVAKSPLTIETSSRRFQKRGVLKSQLKNMWILAQYYGGVSPSKLYHSYYHSRV